MLSVAQKKILIFFSFTIYLSYFFGFYFNENSIGSGGYNGDLAWMLDNFKIFKNNSLIDSIFHEDFFGSRTPLIYVINTLFNPFLNDVYYYRLSVFLFSLVGPSIFYLCLKEKYKKTDKEILLLISSIILLSPYYRTTAIWGLEINYGIITMLISIYYIIKIENNKRYFSYDVVMLTFFSSLTIYFDQKLLFIPLLGLIKLLIVKRHLIYKFLSIGLFTIFSIPFIYLIMQWGSITSPATVGVTPDVANSIEHFNLDFYNLGYATTIIGLYLLPLLIFLFDLSLDKFLIFIKSNFLKIFSFFFIYIFFFLFFDWYYLAQSKAGLYLDAKGSSFGLGFINKFSFILFKDVLFRKVFLVLSFLFYWIVIYPFFNKKIKNILLISFFYFMSLIMTPLMQEYFDPYIFILALLCLDLKLKINFINSIYVMIYYVALLVSANIFYL